VRRLLTSLVRLTGEQLGGGDTRRTRRRSDFSEEDWETALLLAGPDERLVVVGAQPAVDGILAEETVELAHEALLREWQVLRAWISLDRAAILWHQKFASDADIWDSR
jgi:Novel STAND NTPase 1